MNSNLEKPRFRKLSLSECAGARILRTLWDHFDFSFLLSQSGIVKRNGAPAWMLCFLYVIGLISGCTAVSQMAALAAKDAVLSHDLVACLFKHRFSQLPINLMNCISHVYKNNHL